jgi:hypothetical protein
VALTWTCADKRRRTEEVGRAGEKNRWTSAMLRRWFLFQFRLIADSNFPTVANLAKLISKNKSGQTYKKLPLQILIVGATFCTTFVLFKVICYISNYFSNKINHNKIYNFSKNILNKTNGQILRKKSTMLTIKIQME